MLIQEIMVFFMLFACLCALPISATLLQKKTYNWQRATAMPLLVCVLLSLNCVSALIVFNCFYYWGNV